MTLRRSRPRIFVDVQQPGDAGDFVIQVHDPHTKSLIHTNRLPETQSMLQFLHTAKLLERPTIAIADPKDQASRLRQQQRHDDIVRYGKKLYHDLFGAKNAFKNYLKKADHLHKGASIVLRLHSTASELWNIPWEYIHDGERFLNIEGGFTVVRQTSSVRFDASSLKESGLPLRVLVVISDPIDSAPLNAAYEIGLIKEAVGPAVDKGLIAIDYVEEGSLHKLDLRLNDAPYQVLHYTGHGGTAPHGSFLALEDDKGQTVPVFIDELLPVISRPNTLKLVILSGCRTGVIDETQAMSGIATGLLQAVPAVVAMQFSILDVSAQYFAQAFYGAISQGHTLEDAMHKSRLHLHKANARLIDWGIPSLYTHQPELRLVDPRSQPAAPVSAPAVPRPDISALPAPKVFIGRRDEQRKVRQALPDLTYNMTYIWGLGGIGKSALARNIVERPGREDLVQGVLVLRADAVPPTDLFGQLAAWIGKCFPETRAILGNNALKPHERIAQAAPLVQRKRMLLIIDRFDALLRETQKLQWDVPHPLLAQLFYALAEANWSIMTIFTSRYRWNHLNALDPDGLIEIHLEGFDLTELRHAMSQFPHLQKAKPQDLEDFFGRVGGHPQAVHNAEGLLAKYPGRDIMGHARFIEMLADHWRKSFMDEALKQMHPVELKALQTASMISSTFAPQQIQRLAGFKTLEHAEICMARWEALSLANFRALDDKDQPWYYLPSLVRSFLRQDMDPEQKRRLHNEIAEMMLEEWYDMAKFRFIEMGGDEPDPDNKFWTARNELYLYMQHSHVNFASHHVGRAMEWHYHLMQAGKVKEANDIILQIWWFVDVRFGQPEVAEAMLRSVLETSDKGSRAEMTATIGLANILKNQGKYDEAIKLFEVGDKLAAAQNDEYERTRIAGFIARIYLAKGENRKAKNALIGLQKRRVATGDYLGAAVDAIDLARMARYDKQYGEAMEYTRKAEHYLGQEKTPSYETAADMFFERGTIHYLTGKDQEAGDDYNRAAAFYQQVGNIRSYARVLAELAELIRAAGGDLAYALQVVLEAINITEQMNDLEMLPRKLYILGMIYEDQGQFSEAVVQSERAILFCQQSGIEASALMRDALKRQKGKAARGR